MPIIFDFVPGVCYRLGSEVGVGDPVPKFLFKLQFGMFDLILLCHWQKLGLSNWKTFGFKLYCLVVIK